MTVGALAMSTSLKRWFWLAFNAGTALSFAVAMGFTVQNLSVLGAVCGCSLLVLAIGLAIFLYTTLFNLSAGNHTLRVAYREAGALLYKIHFTTTSATPSGVGGAPNN